MLKVILIPFFLIISSFSQAKEYEYQQFLTDNEITPLVKSDADKTVDVIEFSSFKLIKKHYFKRFVLYLSILTHFNFFSLIQNQNPIFF